MVIGSYSLGLLAETSQMEIVVVFLHQNFHSIIQLRIILAEINGAHDNDFVEHKLH